jgi:hypothetical protein
VTVRSENIGKRYLQVIIADIIIAAAAYFFFNKVFALGVIVVLPISLLNVWLLAGAVKSLKGLTPRQAQNRFMFRALVRMIISLSVLIISIHWGIYFMLGVAVGLALQMLTYFKDAFTFLFGKG